jgi:hypothetical protein
VKGATPFWVIWAVAVPLFAPLQEASVWDADKISCALAEPV